MCLSDSLSAYVPCSYTVLLSITVLVNCIRLSTHAANNTNSTNRHGH